METSKECPLMEYENFDGCNMPRQFSAIKERIERLEVRDDDIWVTSYPKSGTTWTQEMVWLLANDLDYEGAKVDLDYRFPFIEINCLVDAENEFRKKYKIDVNVDNCEIPDFIQLINNTPGRRFIKSHLPWNLLPKQIRDGSKTPKMIHVMRDPKQVAVSYYHHEANIFPIFQGSLRYYIDLYMAGQVEHGTYFNVVLSYWNKRHLPNLLLLTYEEMSSDLKAVIRKVAEFLGKSYTTEEIEKLSHHLRFGQMKINTAVNKQNFIKNEKRQFIRKGTTDSYKTELTEDLIAKLDAWVAENTKGTGLPY